MGVIKIIIAFIFACLFFSIFIWGVDWLAEINFDFFAMYHMTADVISRIIHADSRMYGFIGIPYSFGRLWDNYHSNHRIL